jgi:hypothetical protein
LLRIPADISPVDIHRDDLIAPRDISKTDSKGLYGTILAGCSRLEPRNMNSGIGAVEELILPSGSEVV